jgi:hypothetical protein
MRSPVRGVSQLRHEVLVLDAATLLLLLPLSTSWL